MNLKRLDQFTTHKIYFEPKNVPDYLSRMPLWRLKSIFPLSSSRSCKILSVEITIFEVLVVQITVYTSLNLMTKKYQKCKVKRFEGRCVALSNKIDEVQKRFLMIKSYCKSTAKATVKLTIR